MKTVLWETHTEDTMVLGMPLLEKPTTKIPWFYILEDGNYNLYHNVKL